MNTMVWTLLWMFAVASRTQSPAGRSQVMIFMSQTTMTVFAVTPRPQMTMPASMINRGSPDLRSMIVAVFSVNRVVAAIDLSGENSRMKSVV